MMLPQYVYLVGGIWAEIRPNLKKNGIKLKFSGKFHFDLRNNILKFPRISNGGTPLFPVPKSRDSRKILKIALYQIKIKFTFFDRYFDAEKKILLRLLLKIVIY